MANPFDQFDKPKASAAAPLEAAPLIPKVNPFDQFDRQTARPAPREDILGQVGAGVVTGLPNAVTGTSDLLEKGVVDNILFQNPATGRNQIQTTLEAWGDVFSGKDPQAEAAKRSKDSKPYQPSSGTLMKKGLDAVGLDMNDYFAAPKTAGERMARMTGEGAVTALLPLPGAGQAGWAKLAEIAKNIFAGGVGGLSAQGAMEAAPDEWDPLVGLAGGLAGGIGGYGAASLPGAAVKAAGKGIDYLRPAVPTAGNVERLAAERVASAASDPTAAAAAIGNAPELVPGSKPTAFQASGDVGLGSLERALARGDDKFKAALLDRVDQQNQARVAALEGIEESGDVGAAVQFFRDRMRTLEDHADTLYDRAEKAARGEFDALGNRPAGEIGEAARSAIATQLKDMSAEASKLWESIDPDGTLHVETQPLVESAARIYGTMGPEEMTTLTRGERDIANIIGSYDATLPFKRFKELRSAITTAMREAKSFVAPNDVAHRRLTQLRQAIETSVENSVAGKFARDASIADEFVRQAKQWYEARTKSAAAPAGDVTAPGAVPDAMPRASAAVGASGEARAPASEPGAPESDTGLPQYAGPELEASSKAPISARDHYPVDDGTIQSLDPNEIGVDARRFQFKEGGDDQGVTERLQGIEKWDPRLAGTALVFRDAQGKDWVADGHQRTGLARRLMEAGHPPIRINAFVLDAKNGFSDAEARAIAAIKNVAEGTGTPVDAAKVMRAAKETGIDLPPLPPRSALVRDGRALAELSPDAFGMVINDVVPAPYGAIVGRMVKDPLQQEEAVRLIAQLKPDNARQVEMVVRDMLESGTEQMTRQGGLFGEEAFASSVTLERAKIADEALKLLKQDKKLFATLVNQADSIEGSGNRLARETNEARLSTDEKASDLLTQLAFRAGPVSDELSRLARDLKAGRTPTNAAARDFLGAIRGAVEKGLDTGDGAGGVGARAVGEGEAEVAPRDTDTQEMFQAAPPVGSRAFDRWFGDSKVVDAKGKPLVVYHGTGAEFDAFDASLAKSYTDGGMGLAAEGVRPFFFTSSKEVADEFAMGGRTISAYIRMENPLIIEGNKRGWYDFNDDIVRVAKTGSHDGVIIRNANDVMFGDEVDNPISDIYVAFEPTQIKSTENRGNFDPSNPNMFEQSGKPAPWREGEMFGGFETERGLEGLPQAVIPGVKPVTDTDRMGMRAAKPLKGGDAPPPKGGLFDDDSREMQERQGSLFQGEPGGIRNTMAERFAAAGRPAEEAVAAAELVDAFYTTMAQRLGRSVDELVGEHPLPQVKKGGAGGQGSLFQGKGAERNLYVVHNIKPGGVLNAGRIGGLPMPSLAVARIDKGDFGSFGDISLIGSPRLIDPKGGKGAKTYDADVYSPRYPSIHHDIDDKAFNALNRPVVADVKALGGNEHDGVDLSRLEDRGPGDAFESTGLKYAYLKEKGVPVKIAKKEDGSPDWWANREKVESEIRGERRADYEDWAASKLRPLVKRERIFKGFDYNGNRRYREHTIDNVLRDMKARLKEGEGFMYGIGSIRSKHAKKFGSLAAIGKERDRITGTGKMDTAKDTFGDRFFELADEMKPFYRFEANTFGYADDVANMFAEMATRGMRALDEGFKDLPAELTDRVRGFLSELKSAPSEYFETKINRNVGLGEFEAALVPKGTAPRVRQALEKAGLRVVEYDKSNPNARTEAVRQLNEQRPEGEDLLFQPAYHGTPHIFDKFDSSKIGTGEGAQVYGYGLYFAGRKEVAQWYRDALAGKSMIFERGNETIGVNDFRQRVGAAARVAAPDMPISDRNMLAQTISDSIVQGVKDGDSLPDMLAFVRKSDWAPNNKAMWEGALTEAQTWTGSKPGRLFKVDIPADDELMAWDAPLSEQPPAVKRALNKLGQKYLPPEVMIGDKTMSAWELDNGFIRAPEVASEKLRGLLIRNRGDVKATLRQFRDEVPIWVETEAKKAGLLDALEAEAGKVRLEKFDIEAGKGFEQITGKQFYDGLIDNLPKGGNRGRDVQASNLLREAGIPGHRYLDQNSRGSQPYWNVIRESDGVTVSQVTSKAKADELAKAGGFRLEGPIDPRSHNYVIYDDSKIAIQGYEQNKAGPRGRIDFTPDGSVISIFDSADASTALHEAGHHFLKMFRGFAEGADAPESLTRDWAAAKAWWEKNAQAVAKDAGEGVTADDVRRALRGSGTGNSAKDKAIDRGFHEQWARGFEQYLREGKAPNGALRAIFQQFKDWLTTVYRSAMGLNVNITPEVRGIFDRMLATEAPAAKAPRMMDRAAAERFSSATAATREIKDVFGAKPVKQMLKRPGPTYPYDMSAETVAANLFKPGPEGANAIKAARRAGAPIADIEAAAVASLKRVAGKDGVLDPAKLDAWRQKHSDALREVPGLERRLSSARAATETMVDIGERRRAAIDQVQKSALGRLLKIGDDGDAPAVLGRMLGRDTAVKDMRQLAREAAGDPNAIAGLRRAVVEHMVGRLKTPKDALRPDTFQRYLGKNAPALSQVLSPEQMNSLRAIAQDLKRAAKDVRAPGGGSDTAENLAARGRYGVDHPSIIGQIVRRAIGSSAAGVFTHLLAGPVAGAVSGVASFLGGTVLQAFREAGIRRVDDLVRAAILDPELMRVLLMKAPKKKDAGSAVPLRQTLTQLAVNDMLINVGDREKAWRGSGQRERPSTEGKHTGALAVRG